MAIAIVQIIEPSGDRVCGFECRIDRECPQTVQFSRVPLVSRQEDRHPRANEHCPYTEIGRSVDRSTNFDFNEAMVLYKRCDWGAAGRGNWATL